ncbi:hypothetical protein NOS3756_59070 (plasmid) [Nostoc sp. NIES-3756]|uniref:AAA-like domain-containing protein n=1 Tax=Nostoc sp. NIES-3756 TaxID=1751286 RepID=UPI00071FD681|nr:AAA-like domain-containing protein [Nostoc sp. NIES-3756]BAT56895.1 hypothetical protein NOS3756_59070 [Nostoc sp. NIES-3756]
MSIEEALVILDTLIEPGLSDIQELVFRHAWEGKTYPEIADNCGYDANYIKDVGSRLWKLLSSSLQEEVTKSNFRSVLRRRSQTNILPKNLVNTLPVLNHHQQLITTISEAKNISKDIENKSRNTSLDRRVSSLLDNISEQRKSFNPTNTNLELPGGPVSLNSTYYIERPPIEERTYAEIKKPGSLIRIKAPNQMGKTSLMHRILAHGRECGMHTVTISFQKADSQIFKSLEKFLRWFCANITQQLQLPSKLNDYWDEDIGSKVSCTLYMQNYLLAKIDAPVVLALDEVNKIFEYPQICGDFLALLRSWYEDASELAVWQKLRLLVVHATEVYIPLDINQSPFNVGLPIRLPEFSLEQMQDLAIRHGLHCAKGEVGVQRLASLVAMIGGHPYLARVAFYQLANQELTLEHLLQDAPTISGIYSNHLRHHLANLQEHPELAAALKSVVTSSDSVQLEAIAAYKLESMGLVKLEGNQAVPSCELYRLYFREQLS